MLKNHATVHDFFTDNLQKYIINTMLALFSDRHQEN